MEDFESLPEFQALVVAAAEKPERSMGNSVIPAEPPQWGEVRTLARNLAKSAPDQLALHIYLIQAETNVNGFAGFHQSLQSALELLQNQWDSLYPAPDLDDPDDMYYARVNLMNELSEQPVFLDAVHRLVLVSVRGIGDFSTRDIDISVGGIQGSDEEQARCQEGLIRGAFAETDKSELLKLSEILNTLPTMCSTIEALFADKTGQAGVLSLDRLCGRLEACRTRFNEYAGEYLAESITDTDTVVDGLSNVDGIPTEARSAMLKASSLGDRAMVLASFDAVLKYYQDHEPSSPVRVLTYRAREFVEKSFFDVLQAMAPNFRDDLPALLSELQKQPLASLLSDSYARYLGGEMQLSIAEGALAPGSVAPDSVSSNADAADGCASGSSASLGNSHTARVIGSREEVLEVLQDIETYFIAKEPASPIPLILTDIRQLVSKRFVELIAEFSRLLPQSTDGSSG